MSFFRGTFGQGQFGNAAGGGCSHGARVVDEDEAGDVFGGGFQADEGTREGGDEQRDEEAAQEENEPFVDFALGAEARVDAQEKHEGGEFACLAAQAEEEMEEDGQRDGGEEPGGGGIGEEEGHVSNA